MKTRNIIITGIIVIVFFIIIVLLCFHNKLLIDNAIKTQAEETPVIAALLIIFFAFLFIALILLLILYIYSALALQAIAKRTKTKNTWLAWIPFANIYLMTQIGKLPGWVTLFVICTFIPHIGPFIAAIFTITIWWKIAEARKYPGWWGMLMIIPILNFVLIGILAWAKK
ncbi:MAG: hypothetical protein WC254_02840 [Candidatus Woesearchaeota archaeon]|jgi:hypothetical protein